MALAAGGFSGCQDGPLYGLKVANPYFSMREWKRDEELGVTDHERRKQLAKLAETIDQLPADRQQFWAGHLQKIDRERRKSRDASTRGESSRAAR